MSDDRFGILGRSDSDMRSVDFAQGPITTQLIKFLQSPDGGEMSINDCANILEVANEFRASVAVENGVISETKIPALVGKVQSGKTTGMALTIATLADAGIDCFLVLTGTKTTLTEQTADELEEKFESRRRDRGWRWRFVSADTTVDLIENAIVQIIRPQNTLDSTRALLVITCMKEDDYLAKVNEVLLRLVSRDLQLSGRFVVFDDEGDQASTDNSPRRRNRRSTINGLLTDLRSILGVHIFVPVTATPQALLVQDRDSAVRPETAILLTPGTDYVGGDVLFGDDIDSYVRIIPSGDVSALETEDILPPESLQRALATFLLTVALVRKGSRKPIPISMLVHPHQHRRPHTHTVDWVNRVLDGWLTIVTSTIKLEDEACYEFFSDSALDLNQTSSERVQYAGFAPDGDGLVEWIRFACSIIQRIDLQVRKISGNYRFDRDEWNDSDAWIFVGGEVLGRGFVVKGLVTTYMPRDVRVNRQYNVDTLQQRARFFGYKRPYLDLLRGWFPAPLRNKFEQYVEHEEFLWEFLRDQNAAGRDLRHSRAIFELSENARPTRASTNRTRGRVAAVSPNWIQQTYLYDRDLSRNVPRFEEWKSLHTIQKWSPPKFGTAGITYDSWVADRDSIVEILVSWDAVSMDKATLFSVRRQIMKKDPTFEIRAIDMSSKRFATGASEAEGVRSLRGDDYADDPWSYRDFARINNLHSNSPGQADNDCYDDTKGMTFQFYTIQPRGRKQSGVNVEVGALAIRYTDPILRWVLGERD